MKDYMTIKLPPEEAEPLLEKARDLGTTATAIVRTLVRQTVGLPFFNPGLPLGPPTPKATAPTQDRSIKRAPKQPSPPIPDCFAAKIHHTLPITPIDGDDPENGEIINAGVRFQDSRGNLYNEIGELWDPDVRRYVCDHKAIALMPPMSFRLPHGVTRPVDLGAGGETIDEFLARKKREAENLQ